MVELDGEVYCSPIRDAVSRAMRMLSDEPLIDGVPDHCVTERILLSRTSLQILWKA